MKKKAFVLRVNPAMMEKLEKWAADEFRSVNGQIEWILDQALRKAGRNKVSELDTRENKTKNKSTKN